MIEDIVTIAFVAVIAAIVVVLGVAIGKALTAETFELRRDSWTCTQSQTRLMPVIVGKTRVRIPRKTCTQWSRR